MLTSSIQQYPQLRETVHRAVLPCGLTVQAVRRPGYARSYAVLMTQYGSNDSEFIQPDSGVRLSVPDGIAHFLEHQLFAQPDGSADELFAALGASCNAFTTWTRTGYLFSSTNDFWQCLTHLLDFVYQPHFTAEGTAKEKGIIEQEISMYEDDPGWRVYLQLLQGLFQRHPVRNDIAGTAASVAAVSKELLDACYRTFYHPSNMTLVAVGDFDPNEVLRHCGEQMAEKRFPEQGSIQRCYPQEPPEIGQASTTAYASISTPLFALGFKERCTGLTGQLLFRQQVLTELVLHAVIGKSSALYQQLYAAGLVDSDFEASYAGHSDHGYTIMQGESKDPAELHRQIVTGLQRLLAVGIAEEDFQLARRALHGDFLQSLNSLEDLANELADGLFDGVDFLLYPEVLQQLTLADANQRLREHLDPAWAACSQVLPLAQ